MMRKIALILSCMLVTGTVIAQDQGYPWRNPNLDKSQPVSTTAGTERVPRPPLMDPDPRFPARPQDTQKSPSDVPVEDLMKKNQGYFDKTPAAKGNGYYNPGQEPALSLQSGANCECNVTGECFGCPKRAFKKPLFGTVDVYGYAQFGYHDQPSILFNNRPGSFNPQQIWLTLDEPAGRRRPIGMRIDAVYGLDAQFLQARGNSPLGAPDDWDNSWDNGSFGWAIPQAYATWRRDCVEVKAGRFLSPFGYEQIPSIENFFYSRTYTRRFTEPATHTGAIAEVQRSDKMSYLIGATLGWDSAFENVSSGFNILTGMRMQPSRNVKISSTASIGDTGYRNSGTLSSTVVELKLLPRLNYVLQGDILGLSNNDEFGLIQYLLWNVDNRRAFGARLEWWKSDQLTATNRSTYDFTMGANYRPTSNILIRPEVRWDWGGNAVNPGATIFGIDAIIVF